MLLSDRVWKCSTRTRPQQGKHPLAVSSRHGSALISHHWTCNEKQQDVQEEKTIMSRSPCGLDEDLLVESGLCNWILGDTLQDRIGVNNPARCLHRN